MLVRWLVALLILLGLCLTGCGNGDNHGGTTAGVGPAQEIAGDWTGRLTQKGLAPFQIAVRISPAGTGRVAYTGIECGGEWTLKRVLTSSPPAGYSFREDITQGSGGNCKGTGEVGIGPIPTSAPRKLGYGFTGGGVVSQGTLHKTDAAGLKPVFDEAGVTPP